MYTGKSKTISPVYSVGKRITLEEALSLCEKGSTTEEILTRQEERSPGVTFCKTDIGFLEVMEEDAITLEEYKETKKTLDKKIVYSILVIYYFLFIINTHY